MHYTKPEKNTVPTKLERTLLDEAAMNLFQLGDPHMVDLVLHQNFQTLQIFHFCLDILKWPICQNLMNLH